MSAPNPRRDFKGDYMARIAILDALFNWPPDGGARTDIKEIATRLAEHHEVKMFVPDFRWFFPRGRINAQPCFEIEKIPFDPRSFHHTRVADRFKQRVSRFRPDHALIADAWNLKPHLMEAMSDYSTYVREYAYESSCFRTQAFNGKKACALTHLSGNERDRIRCLLCTFKWMARTQPLNHIHEFMAAHAFTREYVRKSRSRLRRLRKIIVYNEFAKSRIEGLNGNIQITPGGVDPNLFKPAPDPRSTRPVHILMVGRATTRMKGFPVLYSACNMLRRDGFDFRLLCTGRSAMQRQGVQCMGWLSQEELPGLYAQSDICVVPSIWPEPFGIVALEAMASGKPVIVSRVGGLQNIIQDGVEGFIVAPGSPEQLRDRLTLLLRDPGLRKRMGEAGRQRVLATYTWDHVYEKHYAPLFDGNI